MGCDATGLACICSNSNVKPVGSFAFHSSPDIGSTTTFRFYCNLEPIVGS
uniref:Phlebovirus_G2 domain-containing protein n=1 Tax=Heterorhabditis bacteriophora TaxID=37862 RepID=A0A1I7WE20_HETBA